MKKIQLSFFWRLLGAFALCSIVPLFLLSVVFTGTSERIIEKNNRRRAEFIVNTAASYFENLIQNAYQVAYTAAADESVIKWCTGGFDKLETSRIISGIFQKYSEFSGDRDFQLFVISNSSSVTSTLSQGLVPRQYEIASYNSWGVLNAVRQSTLQVDSTNRTSQQYVFFPQPHPESGTETVAAVSVPVIKNDNVIGFVIIDILRDNITDSITKESVTNNDKNGKSILAPDISGVLADLLVYDDKYCILYSHFNDSEEGTFWNDRPESQKNQCVFSSLATSVGLSVCGVLPQSESNRYIHDFRSMALLLGFASAFFAFIISFLFTKSIARPVQTLSKAMEKAESGDLSVRCPEPRNPRDSDEMSFLIRRFNIMVARIEKLINDRVEQQRLLRISEVKALQAQISPHFLYNTLNSIKSMAKLAGANNVAKSVTSLGRILRSGFTPGEDFCSIEESLNLVKDYFDIEVARWENRFTLKIEVEPEIMSCPIPKLVIQPVVENALVHGLEDKEGSGQLLIRGAIIPSMDVLFQATDVINISDSTDNTNVTDTTVVIEIIDDGCGISSDKLELIQQGLNNDSTKSIEVSDNQDLGSNGIALVNTNQRLKLIYGVKYGLSVTSEINKGTVVKILIPYKSSSKRSEI